MPQKLCNRWYAAWYRFLELVDYCRNRPHLVTICTAVLIAGLIFQVITLHVTPQTMQDESKGNNDEDSALETPKYNESKLIKLSEESRFETLYDIARMHFRTPESNGRNHLPGPGCRERN